MVRSGLFLVSKALGRYTAEKHKEIDVRTFFMSLVLIMIIGIGGPLDAREIRFAPLPMEERETVTAQFLPMTTFLEQQVGGTISFVYTDSYADLLHQFRENAIDLAYLGPLPYVALRAKDTQAIPLVFFKESSGQTTYTCALIGLAERPLDLTQAQQMRVALTQPLSTCGYLAVNGLLRQHGTSLADTVSTYLGTHDEVALSVVRGEYDFGGVKTSIGKKYAHLGLEILEKTKPLPAFALVANARTLSPETMQAITAALTGLEVPGQDDKLVQSWGDNIRYGAVPASDDVYDVVRGLLGDHVIPEMGNF